MDALDAATLVPALLTGLLGSTHCAAMCAIPMASLSAAPALANIPINGAAGAMAQAHPHTHAWSQAGRVLSYGLAGSLAGGVSTAMGAILNPSTLEAASLVLAVLAQAVLLATGLYLAGWTMALGWLERIARPLWRQLQPLTRRWVPPSSPAAALGFGALWGWVPCGLSWSMLLVALASGSALSGAAVMLSFGLGTMPVMLGSGAIATQLAARARDARWRLGAGLLVIALGMIGMVRVAGSGMGLGDALRLCLSPLWGAP